VDNGINRKGDCEIDPRDNVMKDGENRNNNDRDVYIIRLMYPQECPRSPPSLDPRKAQRQ